MRIPMRDKQPNRPKSLRLKISFFVLQLILGNKNRVIRRKILASLYNLGYRYRYEQGVFSPLFDTFSQENSSTTTKYGSNSKAANTLQTQVFAALCLPYVHLPEVESGINGNKLR